MYPVMRLVWVVATTPLDPKMGPGDASVLRLTCWPWDADVFLELNNGRHLTLYDIGRLHFGKRIGFLGMLRRKRWSLVVGGSSIQYRKRIFPMQRFDLHTRCLGRDEKWFYFQQTVLRGETAHASAVVRTAVIAGPKGTVPTQDVADALGWPDWTGRLPDWVRAWAEADKMRPWPPELGPSGGEAAV